MMKAIHHTAISTPDLDRLKDFYVSQLGFTIENEFGWPKGIEVSDNIVGLKDSAAKVAMLTLGDFRLELFEFSSPTPGTKAKDYPVADHGFTHIAFTVDDIHAEYERLSAQGMVFHCPPQNLGPDSTVTYGRDPDGNVVELMEIKAG